MRISSRQLLDSSQQSMQRSSVDTAAWNQRIATNNRYDRASQSPAAAGRAVELSTIKSRLEFYKGNQNAIESEMTEIDSQIQSLRNALGKIQELSVQARNAAMGKDGINALSQTADQTVQLMKSLVNADNTSGKPLFAEEGIELEIEPGFKVPMNLTRTAILGAGEKGNETVMAAVEAIAKALAEGTAPTLEQMTALNNAASTLMQAQTKAGLVLNQIDSSRSVLLANGDAIDTERTNLLGADVLEASTELTRSQTQLEAARNIFSRLAATGLFNKL